MFGLFSVMLLFNKISFLPNLKQTLALDYIEETKFQLISSSYIGNEHFFEWEFRVKDKEDSKK
jgi:hypothetical protein